MNQLTTLDAGFLKAEDADRRVSLAIGGLAVIEGPAPEQDALVSVVGERMRACPRCAQRLRLRPFDLWAPEWVVDQQAAQCFSYSRTTVPRGVTPICR